MHWLWLFLVVLLANIAAQVLAVLIFKPQMFVRRRKAVAQSETSAEMPIRPATGWFGGLAVGAERDAVRTKQQFRRLPNG